MGAACAFLKLQTGLLGIIFFSVSSIAEKKVTISDVCDLSCCTARERKWKNTIELHCWISHSRGILNGICVAVAFNVTNCKLTSE